MSDKIRFTPVRGTDERIKSYPYQDGYVYFAVDTKQIYMDYNGQNKIPMGAAGSSAAGAGVILGSRKVSLEESTQGTLVFTLSDVNIEYAPSVDSLILNLPDGYFYRVKTIISIDSFEAERLNVAGGGGGGGGGTGGVTLGLEVGGLTTGKTFVYKQKAEITLKGTVDNGDTMAIYNILVSNTYAGSTTQKSYGPYVKEMGQSFVFDLGSILQLGDNTVRISVSSDNANTVKSNTYSMIKCVEMALQSSEDFNPLNFFKGDFNLYCVPVGEGLTKNCYVYVDDALLPALTKKGLTAKNEQVSFTIPAQSHGAHSIRIEMTCDESSATTDLVYNVCCIEDGNDAPVIWYNANTPSQIVNHDILTIEYMVYSPLSTVKQEVHYFINSAEIPTSPLYIDYSKTAWAKWRVNGYSVGDNTFTLKCGSTSVPISIEVAEDTTRNLDIVKTGLHVNLSSVGRSNAENQQSRKTWESTSLYDGSITAVDFKDFNWYNNGWVTDDDGATCLRISNGASIEIPLQGVLNSKALTESVAFEFVFKIRNVAHYGTLINTSVDDESGDTAVVTKTVSSTEGVWASFYKNSIGFCLGTQEAFFKTKNALVSGRYNEDDIVHLTFVVEAAGANSNSNKLIYIYINGINSGITKYNISTDSLKADCPALKINSDYCDVDLYNLRVYKANLPAQLVIQNYLADCNDASLYDMNNEIVTYDKGGIPKIHYLKMLDYNANHEDAPLMPYMLIETTDPNDEMPYFKTEGDGWFANITFVNPTLDYEYSNHKWDAETLKLYGYNSEDEMYVHSCPSFYGVGAEMNVQGTSSQGYPIRNYKFKFKPCTSWNYTNLFDKDGKAIKMDKGGTTANGFKVGKKFFMDSKIGERSFTMKADFMDSSSVHNTGLANLVGTMYSKHPIDDYNIPGADSSTLRTSVYGFPILMFQKLHTGTGDAQYKFLGRYNFNVDKGSDDTFGFKDYGDDKYVDVTNLVTADNYDGGALYIDVEYKESVDGVAVNKSDRVTVEDALELLAPTVNGIALTEDAYNASFTYYRFDEGGDSNALNPEYDPTSPYTRQYLPWSMAAECWEFSNNQGGRCSFKKADFAELSSSGVVSVINDFEPRYHYDADNIENAMLGNHKNDGIDFSGNDSIPARNEFLTKRMARWESVVAWVASTNTAAATNEPLGTTYEYNGATFTNDTADYRIAKFKKEFEQHFDKEYCCVYYLITELLLCYDSRGKNLMMATWGPKVKGGHDIWYPIFYDIDTQLGVNNSGVPYWDYYEEASDNGTFSTADSILWNNLWTCFSNDIMQTFDRLTGNQLTVDKIKGSYAFDPIMNLSKAMEGARPMIIVNVDEYQKYIAPSITGYVNTANQTVTSDAFYYCLQGTRELQRSMFLRNRFNYISSKWRGGDYSIAKAKQGIQMRFDANDYPNTSDKYLNSPNDMYYYSRSEKVASVGKLAINSQATYDTVKSKAKDGTIYLKTNVTEDGQVVTKYIPDESGIYDGAKASEYYIKNDYEYAAYPHPLDFVWDYEVTPYLKQYVSNIWDDTQLPAQYASDGETVTIPIPDYKFNDVMNTANFPQQLVYFGGAEYLSSLGDLSKKYIDQLFMSGARRLKDLRIGSDVPGYWNNMMNTDSFKPDDAATVVDSNGNIKSNPNAKSLLETIVLTNLGGLTNTIDFSGSEKLKELRALGTNVSSFILADGVQIAKLHLPATITNLILKEPTSLTGILTDPSPEEKEIIKYTPETVTEDTYDVSIHYINTLDGFKRCDDADYFGANEDYPDFTEEDGLPFNGTRSYYTRQVTTQSSYPDGLYIAGLTDVTEITDTSATSLDTIDIVGGNMGYDSYTLLDRAVQIKQKMIANKNLDAKYDRHLSINIEEVDWTPYRQVAKGETAVAESVYYLENDHGELKAYEKVSNEYPNWRLNVANGKVFEFLADVYNKNKDAITSLDTLDVFIDDYKRAKTLWDSLENKNNFDGDNYNFYQSTDSYAQGPTLAAITGSIFINNENGDAIDEAELKNYYHDTYYPKLTIYAAKVAKGRVSKFVEVVDAADGTDSGERKTIDTIKYSADRVSPELTSITGSKLNYDFKGWALAPYAQKDLDAMSDSEIDAILLSDEECAALTYANDGEDGVITFYAIYTIHSYTITYSLDDGTVVQTMKVPSTQYIPLPSVMATTDDSKLAETHTYRLIGYSRIKNGTEADVVATKPDDSSKLNIRSTQDMTLYAVFTEDSVYNNILSNNFLSFSPSKFDADNGEVDSRYQVGFGYVVSPASGVSLAGKITLPIWYEGNGADLAPGPVIGLANFDVGTCANVTRIFFEKESIVQTDTGTVTKTNKVRTFGSRCFAEDAKLISVEIPSGLRQIAAYAFSSCSSLLTSDFSGAPIVSIGIRTFEMCWQVKNIEVKLGGDLQTLSNNAFSFYNANITTLTIGSPDKPSQLTSIGVPAVRLNSADQLSAVRIYTNSAHYNYIQSMSNSFACSDVQIINVDET